MNIDFNRVCRLAGIENDTQGRKTLSEAGNRSYNEDPSLATDKKYQFGQGYLNEKEDRYVSEEDQDADQPENPEGAEGTDEMIDVNIDDLMAELRIARKHILKHRQLQESRKNQAIQEAHLKRIIQKEVDNVLSEIEWRDSSWIYGKKQPKRSKKGHVAQGSTIPGIGFTGEIK